MNSEDFEKLNSEQKEKFYDHIYNKSYSGVNLHTESAPETRERLAKLETNQSNLMEKLEENQRLNEKAHDRLMQSITEFHGVMKESMKGMEEKLDKALEKKADKWSEKIWIYFGVTIGGSAIAYAGTLLVKAIIHLN